MKSRWFFVFGICAFAAAADAAPTSSPQLTTSSLEKARLDEAEGCATKTALEAHFHRMKTFEASVATKAAAGLANNAEKTAAEYQ